MVTITKESTDWVEFYQSYLQMQNTETGADFVSCLCVFHEEENASAGFSKKTGVFHCLAEDQSWSPVQFLVEHALMTQEEAHAVVSDYKENHSLVEQFDSFSTKMPTHSPKLEELYKEALLGMREDLVIVEQYIESRGVTYEDLVELGVGYLPDHKTSWRRGSLVFPYTYGGRVVGLRYRDLDSAKGGEEGCHFTLWGIDNLDKNPDTVVIVEGETDRVIVHRAIKNLEGIIVLSTPTATFKTEWVREFEAIRQVILIPQTDAPSQKMAQTARQLLSQLTVLPLRFKRGQVGKDICDWRRFHSSEELGEFIRASIQESTRRVLSAAEFIEVANKPRKWLVTGLMARRHVGMIAGSPKALKTWLLLNLVRTLLVPGEAFCTIPGIVCTEGPCSSLILEEEGDIEELFQRAEKTLQGTPWKEYTYWGHQLGFKWDIPDWVDRISDIIEEKKIDLLFVDPFQRTHNQDENNAGEMGIVWDAVASLIRRHQQLSIVIVHHFTKSGSLSEKWNSFRGSSRTAGEVDFAIFTERRAKPGGLGINIVIDGRSIVSPTSNTGDEILALEFEASTGQFYCTNK